jgi:aspartyl-tRNA(Asn)/glutamyl-tRNA(Gln) amidotransferase subunit B
VLRSKELAHDYRYFPEPDLVPIVPSAELIEELRAALPELPAARVRRFESDYALPLAQALDLGVSSELARYFEEVAAGAGDARLGANWVLNEFSAHLNEARLSPSESPVRPASLAALIGRVADGTLGSSGAKQVFAALVEGEGGGDPAAIVEARGLGQIADTGELAKVVTEVVAAHPGQAEQFRSGKENLIGFFVGQVMKATGGRAEPQIVQKLLREELARV